MAGLTREEAVDRVIKLEAQASRTAVGLDFSFSFPAWFCRQQGARDFAGVWSLAAQERDRWFDQKTGPFFDRTTGRPPGPMQGPALRATEALMRHGATPGTTFALGGQGSVGKGSLYGMPLLLTLKQAGFAVLPFMASSWPRVFEVYPAVLYGRGVVKSSQGDRQALLEERFADQDKDLLSEAASSDHSFDAAVTALTIAENFEAVPRVPEGADGIEGAIWMPIP